MPYFLDQLHLVWGRCRDALRKHNPNWAIAWRGMRLRIKDLQVMTQQMEKQRDLEVLGFSLLLCCPMCASARWWTRIWGELCWGVGGAEAKNVTGLQQHWTHNTAHCTARCRWNSETRRSSSGTLLGIRSFFQCLRSPADFWSSSS